MVLTYSQAWELPLTGGADETGDSALIRTLFLPAYGAGVVLLGFGATNAVRGLIRQPFLAALMAIACLSVFWSVAPDQTGRRIFALAFTTLGGVVLAARYSWARLAEVLATAFAILAAASLFVCLFIPSIGRMTEIFPGAWRGLWIEKNAFGDNMAMGASIAAAAALLNPRRAGVWWGVAALAFALVLGSTSKTALVSAMLGAGAFLLVGLVRRGPIGAVAATWTAAIVLALLVGAMLFASGAVFGLLGKDATLTGRTRIWAAVLRQIAERPWQGYGYGAIWSETDQWGPLARIVQQAGFRPLHSHNAWLEQWLAMGVLGLSAWVGFFTQTFAANVWALYRRRAAYLTLPFFVVFAMMTLTESVAVTYNDMRWVIFVALAVRLSLPDDLPLTTRMPAAALAAPGTSGRWRARRDHRP
ncbi:MAG TPA: O-antigen ligase [Caulobacteraceae bacterium]|nr:O-antigen ligase [Caulobacteraceae bacterium]